MPIRTIRHPLAQHYLTHLRDETTSHALFRTLARKLSVLLALEATRELKTTLRKIKTPLEEINSPVLDEELVIIPILRSGLGMLEPIVDLFPKISVGYIGLERDEATAVASSYYRKLPDLKGKTVLLVDPMLATGGSANRALADIFENGAAKVLLLCIVAAPEGVAVVEKAFPKVQIYTASVDRELNANKYIMPGLGDFGDRLYGTH